MLIETVAELNTSVPDAARSGSSGIASGRVRLDAAEECRLARAWRERGSTAARERLITANLGLVVAIAQRYRFSGVPLEELVAEGNLGLVQAVDGFDPECGSRLSTYSAYWIRQGISRAFAASSPRGRLNSRDRRDLAEYEKAIRRHFALIGSLPTDAEVGEFLGWPADRVAACRDRSVAYSRPCSLDQPRPGALRPFAANGAPEHTRAPDQDASHRLTGLLSCLTELERHALTMRYGLGGREPKTIDVIARQLGESRRHVRSALHSAMTRLSRRARGPQSGAAFLEDDPHHVVRSTLHHDHASLSS